MDHITLPASSARKKSMTWNLLSFSHSPPLHAWAKVGLMRFNINIHPESGLHRLILP